jgi:FkbM family methyltransferase
LTLGKATRQADNEVREIGRKRAGSQAGRGILMLKHPIFDRFQAYSGPQTQHVDWIGMRYRPEWWPDVPTPEFPALNEELFEWIDLLESVDAARGRFTMLELGAGFGRWGIRGALAAKQRGIRDIRARFVEGEPQHVRWIRDALALNGLDDIDAGIVEAATSYGGKPIPFAVAMKDYDARSWYGQAVRPPAGLNPTERTYFGRRVHELSWGDAIYVDAVTFEELAAGLDLVDLVDMDLQGAELELIENAAALFSRKVRRVHIGTHGSQIEDKLRRIFQSEGWTPQWDFPLQTRVETEFGPVFFNDGVQGWINPRLS